MDGSVLRDDMADGLGHSLESLPEAVSIAMRSVPRHEFVTDSPYQDRLVEHRGTSTTTLTPTTIARLLTALDPQPDDEVLVVGAGVGCTTVVLAKIVDGARVHAADITCSLVYEIRENLQRAGYGSALVNCRNNAKGLTDYAPFDRILVEVSTVRPPARFLAQLADGGRLVMPKGVGEQTLVAVKNGEMTKSFGPLSFKPLLADGEQTGSIVRNQTRHEDPEYEGRGRHADHGRKQDWVDWGGSG